MKVLFCRELLGCSVNLGIRGQSSLWYGTPCEGKNAPASLTSSCLLSIPSESHAGKRQVEVLDQPDY